MSNTTPNPFPAAIALVEETIKSLEGTRVFVGAQVHRYILTVLLGMSLVLVVAALSIRLYKRSFWIVRWTPSPQGGRFVTPNSVICWLVFSLPFLVLVQLYLWAPSYSIDILAWIPLYIGRWFISLSTTVAVLNRPASTSHRFDLARHATLINIFFLTLPVALLVSLITLTVLQVHSFDLAINSTLLPLLVGANEHFVGGRLDLILIDINAIGIAQAQFGADIVSGIAYLKAIWIIWMVAALVESLVFVSASGYHGRVMYGSFKRMKNDSSIETGGGRSKKMNVISSNLYSLGLQSIVSSVIGATHFTVSVILAFFPVHDPTLVGYVGVYMIAIFGGATYGLIFIRTIASSRNNTPTPSTANPSFVQSRTGPYLSSRSNDVSPGSARPFQIESFDHINELEMEPVFLKEKDDVDSKEILRVV